MTLTVFFFKGQLLWNKDLTRFSDILQSTKLRVCKKLFLILSFLNVLLWILGLNRCLLIMREIKAPVFHLCFHPALYSELILIYIFLLHLYLQNTWLDKHFHMLIFSSSSEIADCKIKMWQIFNLSPYGGKITVNLLC